MANALGHARVCLLIHHRKAKAKGLLSGSESSHFTGGDMGDIRNVSKSRKARNRRIIKLAPMTRAVRSALAVSALTLGIGLTGNVSAARHTLPATMVHALQTGRSAIDSAPVFDLTVVHDSAPLGVAPPVMPTLIGTEIHLAGDVVIDNATGGTWSIPGGSEEVIGISGYSDGGDVIITNQAGADLYVDTAGDGNAIGIYGYALAGDTTIDNAANLDAMSAYGLADGIFASGAIVGVTNSGEINASGDTWAAGIEAQGSDATSVSNSGDINASAMPFLQVEDDDGIVFSTEGYQAFGIYATAGSGGAVVDNTGNVHVEAGNATGLYVLSQGDATVGNSGNIYAGSGLHGHSGQTYDYYYGTGNAVGINVSSGGVDAAIGIDNDGIVVASGILSGTGITGVASEEGGTIDVANDGIVVGASYFGSASGIVVSGYAGASIENNGGVGAYVYYGTASGVTALSFAGDTSVTNAGDVIAAGTSGAAIGAINAYGIVSASGFGNASVDNSGYVRATGAVTGTGIDASAGAAGAVSVTNSGDIVAETGLFNNARADGIKASAGDGGIEVQNSGSIQVDSALLAFGVYSSSSTGDTLIENTADGSIEFYSYLDRGFGMFAFAEQGDVSIDNAGDIYGYAWKQAYGARVRDLYGDATIDNSGTIAVESGSNKAFGLLVSATYEGTAGITNSGDIEVVSRTGSYGMRAYGYAGADVGNSGTIYAASANGVAVGMMAQAGAGDVTVANTGGSIEALAATAAFGVYASSAYGSVTVSNDSEIHALGINNSATGIKAVAAGDVDIVNSAYIYAASLGNAFGLYGYAAGGDVTVDNSGDMYVRGVNGLADGIFAGGVNVEVSNTGGITAIGSTWASGIEAEGTYDATVQNDGVILAVATGVNGHANGIYATGSTGVTIGNTGDIGAYGTYATGIEAQSQGGIAIDNSGNIIAEDDGYGLATAIHAISGGEGAAVSITNAGDISVQSYYGASGIVAVSGGLGGTASVNNDGDIEVTQGYKYGYAAYGIVSSADGASSIVNNGSITVTSDSPVTGLAALSFAGDASVTNAGDIAIHSEAVAYYAANGIVSFAGNGSASATSSGNIDVSTKYIGTGMDVNGLEGAVASSSGDISVDAWRAYGIHAQSGNGDVSVDNSGSIYATYSGTYFAGTVFGILATSINGDVSVNSSGDITTHVQDQSVGIFAMSDYGSISIANSGAISAYSTDGYAVGLFARADEGAVTVDSSAAIDAYSYNGYAFGVLARGDTVDVDSSGDVSANALYEAVGIAASSFNGTTVVATGDSISAYALGAATGIDAQSAGGDVMVTNASDIEATGVVLGARGVLAAAGYDVTIDNSGDIAALSLDGDATGIFGYSLAGETSIGNSGAVEAGSYNGDAIGIYGYSLTGDVAIENSGDLAATSVYGLADGIFASGQDVDVASSGAITASGYLWAAGIEAQGSNSTQVSNSGDISASGMPFLQVEYDGSVLGSANGGQAFGIYVTAGMGGAAVTNSGNIAVDAGYATGIEAQSGADLSITNSGDIAVGSGLNSYYNSGNYYAYYYGTQLAAGINATSNGEGAHVVVSSSGDIVADGIFGATGIAAVSSGYGGTAGVSNSGNITVAQNQKYGYGAYGIVTSADGDSFIDNSGIVEVYSGGVANGLAALSFAGDAGVVNAGDIAVVGTASGYYGATGILAFAGNGSAYVNNSGAVAADWSGVLYASARAVDAQGLQGVLVKNSGSLYASGKYAYGVYAASAGGDVAVHNEDEGEIGFYSYLGDGFGVLGIATTGDVAVINDGSISGYAYGQSAGIFGVALQGDVDVGNYGAIDVTTGGSVAVGAFARADYGTATVVNGGDISVSVFPDSSYHGYDAYGAFARSAYGYAAAGNSGTITVEGYYSATGIAARSYAGTTVSTAAGSQINATADFVAIGIEGRAEAGDVTVGSAGGITTSGAYGSVGIQAYSAMGDVTVASTGHIDAASEYGIAIGATAYTMAGDVAVSNGGLIEAAGGIGSYGILAQSYAGNVVVNNAAAGHVEAAGGIEAIAVLVNSGDGDSTVNNAGVIHAGDAYYATAVLFEGVYGSNTLNNLGTGAISVDGDDGYAFAVAGTDAIETINNSGDIEGAIWLASGNDVFNNASGGTWDVGSTLSTDFGDGNDTLANAAGGTITLDGGQIAFGAGDDTINNAGLIRLTNGTITMGEDLPLLQQQAIVPQAVELNAFNNSGTLKVEGASAIDTAGGTFTNTGMVDFVNDATTDALLLDGTLAGTGQMGIDVNFDDLTADQLLVNGDVASGAVQTVNIKFTGVPTIDAPMIDFVSVAGTSVAGNFVAGHVVGYNQNANFLTLGVGVASALDATNATDDVFSIGLTVDGLSDGGVLAATAASGAAGFLNSQVGTFRQRLGVNPYGDAGKVMSAFVRFYSDQGDVNPTHAAGNFGQGGNFAFEQTSWGREVGVNANLFGNFHAGVVLGNADSRQRLTDGVGENRMNGTTFGAYATWYVPEGLYVDLSGRWMGADIRSNSVGANLQSRARSSAVSLEAGYEWKLGGVNVVPQAQYIRTRVEDVRTFYGENLDFTVHGGTFERGRLGVEVNRTFQSGDIRWTPYGSVSAVRDSGGKTAYNVGDFYGATGTSGSRTMAELGLGVQKGGLGFTLGMNWLDGGALKSFVGGQASVRYSW